MLPWKILPWWLGGAQGVPGPQGPSGPAGAPGGSDVIIFGDNRVGNTTTTRYLSPFFTDSLSETGPIQFRIQRAGTLQNLRVRHNVTAGNGNSIVYTIRVNGVPSLVTVSLASTTADGSDLVNTVVVVAGDLIDIEVTKALGIGTSPKNIVASAEFV